MAIIAFPPIESTDKDGLLALGGDLEVESLLLAYKQGIFPWPISQEFPLAWFSPDPRGILHYDYLGISHSLKKTIRKNKFEIKFNQDFPSVILGCQKAHSRDNAPTWITEEIILGYTNLFFSGHAYSVEAYYNHELVGGVYGVTIGGFISGESMFHTKSDASKVALVSLMEHLHAHDIHWMDIQTVSPLIKSMGGMAIPRNTYIEILKEALKKRPTGNLFNRVPPNI